jgi:NADH-quinone oxidoreductase subunit N
LTIDHSQLTIHKGVVLNEVAASGLSVGQLGAILPEIILLIGGLLVLIFDWVQGPKSDSGRGFMALAVVTLIAGVIGVAIQFAGVLRPEASGGGAYTALYLVDVDPFGLFLKIIIYTGMALVALAGGAHMNARVSGRGEFWVLFLFVTLAMSLAVSANNLLLIFLAIEFLSITSYLLVGFVREDQRSSEAGVKYFLYGSVASSVMLYGMSLLYGATGSLNLSLIGQTLAENTQVLENIILPTTLLLLVGLGFKASLAPFYQWAPDTYEGAPTPVTAYLSTASKAVGFAVAARILIVALMPYRVDWVPLLSGLSIFTMTVGNLIALRQTNVKRMLAYSSVAQAGYMLMGLVAIVAADQVDVSTLAINGLNAMLIYLFAYLFTNIGAFMIVMAIEEYTGSAELSAFNNLARRNPGLAWSMFLFMLSLTGIPLTGGFIGKFYVFGAAVQHQYYWLAGIAVVNAGIAAFYYLNVVRAMFFAGDESDAQRTPMPVSIPVQLALIVCVVATLWIGVYPPNLIKWANDASQQLLAVVF